MSQIVYFEIQNTIIANIYYIIVPPICEIVLHTWVIVHGHWSRWGINLWLGNFFENQALFLACWLITSSTATCYWPEGVLDNNLLLAKRVPDNNLLLAGMVPNNIFIINLKWKSRRIKETLSWNCNNLCFLIESCLADRAIVA